MKLRKYLFPLIVVLVTSFWCSSSSKPDTPHTHSSVYELLQRITFLFWVCPIGLFVFGWFTAATDDLAWFINKVKYLIYATNSTLIFVVLSAPYTMESQLLFLSIFIGTQYAMCLMIKTQHPRDQLSLWPWFHYMYNIIALSSVLGWLYGKLDVVYVLFGVGTVIFIFFPLKNIIIDFFEMVVKLFQKIF